jgi:hypothetical protein
MLSLFMETEPSKRPLRLTEALCVLYLRILMSKRQVTFVMKVVHPDRLGRAQRQNSTFDSNAVPLPAFLARMSGHKLSR